MPSILNDPYCYPGSSVLANKLGLRSQKELDTAEADLVAICLKELAQSPLEGSYDFSHLCAIHRYLFCDLFEWAGKPRINAIFKFEPILAMRSIQYAEPHAIEKQANTVIEVLKSEPWTQLDIEKQAERFSRYYAALWKIHPFREGNTRTITQFCCQYADSINIPLDQNLLARHSEYLRNALVAANAVFDDDDLGDRSKPEYLYRIILDAMQRGRS